MDEKDKKIISDWSGETPEAKARWFRSLSMEERARVFCDFYRLVKKLNPNIAEKKNAGWKRAANQLVDLGNVRPFRMN